MSAEVQTSEPPQVSSFIQDFLENGEGQRSASAQSATAKKRVRSGGGDEEDLKADRKRERERRRRAEVGEKFDELTKVLALGEAALGQAQPVSAADDAGSRADVLQRTIDTLAALTKAVKARSADEQSAAGGLCGMSRPTSTVASQTEPQTEGVMVIAQTQVSRAHLENLVRSGKAIVTTNQPVAAAVAAAGFALPLPRAAEEVPPPSSTDDLLVSTSRPAFFAKAA